MATVAWKDLHATYEASRRRLDALSRHIGGASLSDEETQKHIGSLRWDVDDIHRKTLEQEREKGMLSHRHVRSGPIF